MPKTKTNLRTAPRGGSEHDFAQPRENWETAVFDRAARFAVIEMRNERKRTEFRMLPWAIQFARERDDSCLYAVCETGRFALLDRARWPDWEQRWRMADEDRASPWLMKTHQKALEVVAASTLGPMQKPHLGTITDWETQSSPQGLGYCVSGRLGARKVITTSILARSGDEVETLNWRYTLGEEK